MRMEAEGAGEGGVGVEREDVHRLHVDGRPKVEREDEARERNIAIRLERRKLCERRRGGVSVSEGS